MKSFLISISFLFAVAFANAQNSNTAFCDSKSKLIKGIETGLIEIKLPEAVTNSEVEKYAEYYKNAFVVSFNEKTHIAKFVEGRGMHEHFDASRPKDIATLVYLNDEYQGGDIYFPKYEMSFKPEPGDLLCFPDNPDFVHGVKPIIKGTRFTLPRWFTRIV